MTTITAHSAHATLVNVFTVEPARARALADLLTAATETVMCHLEGFRSANIHVSLDQTRVVNYAQWESTEMYLKMLSDPVAQEHMRKAADLATSFDPNLYTVESVHERA
jgi:quinol monooxygenase YgiN